MAAEKIIFTEGYVTQLWEGECEMSVPKFVACLNAKVASLLAELQKEKRIVSEVTNESYRLAKENEGRRRNNELLAKDCSRIVALNATYRSALDNILNHATHRGETIINKTETLRCMAREALAKGEEMK